MPTFDGRINEFVAGDRLEIRRTITVGAAVQTAWLTIKNKPGDTDENAVVQKEVTTDLVDNVGQIVAAGDGDTDAEVVFFLTSENTAELHKRLFYYDIQVETADGAKYTPEQGRIQARQQITRA